MTRIDQGVDFEVRPKVKPKRLRHRVVKILSLLPFKVLRYLGKRFPRAWIAPLSIDPEDWGIFLDADYWKWVRIDKRKHRA